MVHFSGSLAKISESEEFIESYFYGEWGENPRRRKKHFSDLGFRLRGVQVETREDVTQWTRKIENSHSF